MFSFNCQIGFATDGTLMSVTRTPATSSVKVGDNFDVNYVITPKPITAPVDNRIKDIVLVVDTSLSMDFTLTNDTTAAAGSSRLDSLKRVAKDFVSKFNDSNVNIALVKFHGIASTVAGYTKTSDTTAMASLNSKIDGLNTTGSSGTNIGDGIRKAYYMLGDANTNPTHDKYIVLLTDGVANFSSIYVASNKNSYNSMPELTSNYVYDFTNNSYNYTYNSQYTYFYYSPTNSTMYRTSYSDTDTQALNYATQVSSNYVKPAKINTYVIGFGPDTSSINNNIATAAGGTYQNVSNETALTTLYNKIYTSINNPTATAYFEDAIPSGAVYVSASPAIVTSTGSKISGSTTVTYRRDTTDTTKFIADPINIKVTYKAAAPDTNTINNSSISFANNSGFATLTPSNFSSSAETIQLSPANTVTVNALSAPVITPDITALTSSNVNASITYDANAVTKLYSTDNSTWKAYTAPVVFTANGTLYTKETDAYNRTVTGTSLTISNIDKTLPSATVSYSITTPTNGTVTATLNPSKTVTVTNNGGSKTYVFTDNGSFTFQFKDSLNNVGTAVATVTNIDKIPPTGTISYTTTSPTNQDVIATLSPSESVTVTNNGGSLSHTFTANGTFTYTIQDAAGNVGQVTATVNNIDKTAPTATISYSTTNPTNNSVVATLVPSEAVTVMNNSGLSQYTFTDNGSFTFQFTDAAGNTGSATATVNNIDKTKPSTPIILTPAEGYTTNNDKPVISGTAEAGSTVKIYIDNTFYAQVITNSQGSWSYTPTNSLASSVHTITATATDAAGNISDVSATRTFTIDKTAPTLPNVSIISNNSNPALAKVNDIVTLNFTANKTLTGLPVVVIANHTVTAVKGSGNSYSASYTMTSNDSDSSSNVSFSIDFTDVYGNVGTTVHGTTDGTSVRFDKTPPTLSYVAIQSNNTLNSSMAKIGNTVTVNFTASENLLGNTATVKIDGYNATVTSLGNNNYTATLQLSDSDKEGNLTIKIDFTDLAGNAGATVTATTNGSSVKFDKTAPVTPSITSPSSNAYLNNNLPVIAGTAEANSSVYIILDGVTYGPVVTDSTGKWTFTPTATLLDGTHTVSAYSMDGAGNTSGTSSLNSFTVDTTAPTLSPVNIVSSNSDHTRAKSGDTITLSFTVSEAVAALPIVTIAGHPVTVTNVSGNSYMATYKMVSSDSQGTVAYTINFTDIAGNGGTTVSTSTDGSSVVFDSVRPTLSGVTISSNNNDKTLATIYNTITVQFTASESLLSSSIIVTIDGQVATVTSLGNNKYKATYVMQSGDTEGNIPFTIDFKDLAGNSGTQVTGTSDGSAVTYDSTGPNAPIILKPAEGYTNDNTPLISGTAEADTKVTILINGTEKGTVTVGSDGKWSFTSPQLSDDTYVITAYATDAAGNASMESDSKIIIVDTTPPDRPVISNTTVNGVKSVKIITEGNAYVDVYVNSNLVTTIRANSSGVCNYTPDGVNVKSLVGTVVYVRARDEVNNISANSNTLRNITQKFNARVTVSTSTGTSSGIIWLPVPDATLKSALLSQNYGNNVLLGSNCYAEQLDKVYNKIQLTSSNLYYKKDVKGNPQIGLIGKVKKAGGSVNFEITIVLGYDTYIIDINVKTLAGSGLM